MNKKLHIERFQDEEVRQKYQETLRVHVDSGSELVKAVVQDWKDTAKRRASKEIGDKRIVCGNVEGDAECLGNNYRGNTPLNVVGKRLLQDSK